MDVDGFKRELAEMGFNEVLTRVWPANLVIETHTHDFEVRALVLEGEFVLGCDGQDKLLRPGDVFTLDAKHPHSERYGPQGATYLVGRKYSA
jgi:quercetin dioxygenase-like cupin family protein